MTVYKIEFTENEVFTYSAEDLVVGVHSSEFQFAQTMTVKFANPQQVYHFKEMLDFILEKRS